MSETLNKVKKILLETFLRQPLSFSILVLSIVIVVIYVDYRGLVKAQNPQTIAAESATENLAGGSGSMGFVPRAPDLSESGRNQPKLVDNLGAAANTGAAPGLEGLIQGLEAKVAADPKDIGKRVLLAQTYRELGMAEKSLDTLTALLKEFPDNLRVKLVMASVLSQRDDEKELNQSLKLLNELAKVDDEMVKPYLVKMYQGDAYIRLKNHASALENWNAALKIMPAEDNRYGMLKERIDNLTAGKVGAPKDLSPPKG